MTTPDLTIPEWLRRLMLDWQLNEHQLAQLLHVDEQRLGTELKKPISEARAGATVPPGFDCAPALIRIYQLLGARFPEIEDQVKWLFTSNQDFGGEKPVEVATSSRENLFWISYYLESSRAANPGEEKQTD